MVEASGFASRVMSSYRSISTVNMLFIAMHFGKVNCIMENDWHRENHGTKYGDDDMDRHHAANLYIHL